MSTENQALALSAFNLLLNPYKGRFGRGKGLTSILNGFYHKLLFNNPLSVDEITTALKHLEELCAQTNLELNNATSKHTEVTTQLAKAKGRWAKRPLEVQINDLDNEIRVLTRDTKNYQSLIEALKKLQVQAETPALDAV